MSNDGLALNPEMHGRGLTVRLAALIACGLLGAAATEGQAATLLQFALEGCPGSPLPLDRFSGEGASGGLGDVVTYTLSSDTSGTLSFTEEVELEIEGLVAARLVVASGEEIGFSVTCDASTGATYELTGFDFEVELKAEYFGGDASASVAGAGLVVTYSAGGTLTGVELVGATAVLGSFSIGDTGIGLDGATLELGNLMSPSLDLSGGSISFDGVLSFLNGIGVTASGVKISQDGLSGTFTSGAADTTLFGSTFSLEGLEIAFERNSIVSSSIVGDLEPPFLKSFTTSSIGLELSLQADGEVRVEATPTSTGDLLTLDFPDAFQLEIKGIDFELGPGAASSADGGPTSEDGYRIRFDGDMELKFLERFGQQSRTAEVEGLTVDNEGKLSLDGGFIRLPEPIDIDLHGFKLSLKQLTFATQDDESPGASEESQTSWLAFDADVSLTELLPVSASAKTCRVVFSGNPLSTGDDSFKYSRFELNGIGIDFRQPGVIHILGDVEWFNPDDIGSIAGIAGFSGRVLTDIEALQLSTDAALQIGQDVDRGFKFFYASLDSSFPTGIPIFAGVSCYGLGGLFASNMSPNLGGFGDPAEWAVEEAESPGNLTADPPTWVLDEGALSFGVATLIGSADNGYTVHAKGALIVNTSGPTIYLTALANLLEKRGSFKDGTKPALEAYALYNGGGNPRTFELGVGMNYDSFSLDISGEAEAFFNLDTPSDWHVYLGQVGGQEIQATVVELFNVKTFYMIHPDKCDFDGDPDICLTGEDDTAPFSVNPVPDLAFGAGVGFDKEVKAGPLAVFLRALLDFWAGIKVIPLHFQGGVNLDGGVGLRAFGFEAGFEVAAGLEFETPTPFVIDGELKVSLNVPKPFKDPSATIHLRWDNEDEPEPIEPFDRIELTARDGTGGIDAVSDAAASFVVPLDHVTNILFKRPMNDSASRYVEADDSQCEAVITDVVRAGVVEYRYDLVSATVSTQSYLADGTTAGWSSPLSQPLGAWLHSDAGECRRTLVLGTENPLYHYSATSLDFTETVSGGKCWGDECVLLPYTDYAVHVTTSSENTAGEDPATTSHEDVAYFRTQGPPLDLDPYVLELAPSTSTRPHFREYWPAVRCNRGYIDLLYLDPDLTASGIMVCDGEPGLTARLLDSSRQPLADADGNEEIPVVFTSALDAADDMTAFWNEVSGTELKDDILHVDIPPNLLRPGELHTVQIVWKDPRLATLDTEYATLLADYDTNPKLDHPAYFAVTRGQPEVVIHELPLLASRYADLGELFATFADDQASGGGCLSSFRLLGGNDMAGTYFEIAVDDDDAWEGAETVVAALEGAVGDDDRLRELAIKLSDAHPDASSSTVDEETLQGWLETLHGGYSLAVDPSLASVRAVWDLEKSAFDAIHEALDLKRDLEPLPEVVEISLLGDSAGPRGFLLELPEPLDFSRVTVLEAEHVSTGLVLRPIKSSSGTRVFFFDWDGSSLAALPADGNWRLTIRYQGHDHASGWLAPPLFRDGVFPEGSGAAIDDESFEQVRLCFTLGTDLFNPEE